MPLAVKIVVPIIVGLGLVLTIVFTLVFGAIKRRVARELAGLHDEGIVLDSGMVGGTARHRDYRAPGRYISANISTTRRHLVLTRKQLAMLGTYTTCVPYAELHRYQVGVLDGRLLVKSDQPLGATGYIELRLKVPDPAGWAQALRDAGATAAA